MERFGLRQSKQRGVQMSEDAEERDRRSGKNRRGERILGRRDCIGVRGEGVSKKKKKGKLGQAISQRGNEAECLQGV